MAGLQGKADMTLLHSWYVSDRIAFGRPRSGPNMTARSKWSIDSQVKSLALTGEKGEFNGDRHNRWEVKIWLTMDPFLGALEEFYREGALRSPGPE